MKKTLKVVLCLALAALMLCSSVAFAADGDLDVLADTGVTITGTGGTLTVTVPTSLATSGTQYVVLVVKAKNVPATADDATKLLAAAKAGTATYDVGEDTILYIDQNAATATGITFTGKPKSGGDAIIVLGGGAEPAILGVIKGHGVTVSGKATVKGATTGNVTVTADADHSDTKAVGANGEANYSIAAVPTDVTSITVSSDIKGADNKVKYVNRAYTIDASADVTKDVQINPLGDVNGDGRVNAGDYVMVLTQAKAGASGTTLQDYAFTCGDVNKSGSVVGDGKINAADYVMVLSQAKGNSVLW